MLRLAKSKDAARLAEIFAPYVRKSAITFSEDVPTEASFRQKIAELSAAYPFLVLEKKGRVEAYAYASPHRTLAAYRWCAEVSVYVDEAARQGGLGSALYGALLPILRRQRLHQAYAGITLPNEASIRLHEKFSFRHFATYQKVGYKAGAWRDVGWWELGLQPSWDSPPLEPKKFSHLDTGAVHALFKGRLSN